MEKVTSVTNTNYRSNYLKNTPIEEGNSNLGQQLENMSNKT